MIVNALSDLPHRRTQAVIINVGTFAATALAILSTLRYAGMPLLVIDCPLPNNNGNPDFPRLVQLMAANEFDLMTMPLNIHGVTLDYIFRNIKADYVLLVDSDTEILNGELFPLMEKHLGIGNVFGYGFSHGPCWLRPGDWNENREGYLPERMWIPFTMLNAALVREALNDGKSFQAKMYYNLFSFSPRLSEFLIRRVPFFKTSNYSFMNWFKRDAFGKKVSLWYYDTGAEMFQHLKNNRQYCYIGLDIATGIVHDYVSHYEGITRRMLCEGDTQNSTSLDGVQDVIVKRLKDVYGFKVMEYL
jgi:hypothetical protein